MIPTKVGERFTVDGVPDTEFVVTRGTGDVGLSAVQFEARDVKWKRTEVKWPRGDWRRLIKAGRFLAEQRDSLYLRCDKRNCPDPHIVIRGSIARCGCTDRVFSEEA